MKPDDRVRLLENRVADLERMLQLQGAINGKLLENMNRLLVESARPAPSLILPERMN